MNENNEKQSNNKNFNISKRNKIIAIAVIIIIAVSGLFIFETIKTKRNLKNMFENNREAVRQESTRYEIVSNDLEQLKKEIMNMSSKYLDPEHKTDIVSNIDDLLKAMNKKNERLYLPLKILSESIVNSGAYMDEDKIDDYLSRFTYMLESMAIVERITIEDAEILAVGYNEAIQTMGLNDIYMDFEKALKGIL